MKGYCVQRNAKWLLLKINNTKFKHGPLGQNARKLARTDINRSTSSSKGLHWAENKIFRCTYSLNYTLNRFECFTCHVCFPNRIIKAYQLKNERNSKSNVHQICVNVIGSSLLILILPLNLTILSFYAWPYFCQTHLFTKLLLLQNLEMASACFSIFPPKLQRNRGKQTGKELDMNRCVCVRGPRSLSTLNTNSCRLFEFMTKEKSYEER